MEVLDDMNEFKELKQTGSLRDYLKAFEVLLDKAQLNEEQALRCFLAGLEHELKMMVTMFNPKTLKEAYSLAKLQDAVKSDLAGHGQGKGFFNKNQDSSASLQVEKTNLSLSNSVNMGVNIRENNPAFVKDPLNLTPKQREERRLKNQCCWWVYRLKKFMVLIGTSSHCICVMICLQVKNQRQWQFGRNCHLQKLIESLLLKFKEGFLLSPLRTRDLMGEVVVMKKCSYYEERWKLLEKDVRCWN